MKKIVFRNYQEFQQILSKGEKNRKYANTLYNSNSSRSHTIFTIYVKKKSSDFKGGNIGQIAFVDLAGNERLNFDFDS